MTLIVFLKDLKVLRIRTDNSTRAIDFQKFDIRTRNDVDFYDHLDSWNPDGRLQNLSIEPVALLQSSTSDKRVDRKAR